MKIEPGIVYELHEKMASQQIISAYQGEFSHDVINMLLKHARRELDGRSDDLRAAKKTYNILVECLENILKHSSKVLMVGEDDKRSQGIILLSEIDGHFMVNVGNQIPKGDQEQLESKLEEVNEGDRGDLKEKYKHIITEGSVSERGGAGLGIVDIALKAGSKLEYEFHEYDDNSVFYVLRVKIIVEE